MIRLALRVRREDAEVVLAELLELAPAGIEEVGAPGEQFVEYAVYGAPGELPELPDLCAAAGDALVEISTSKIADDWPERWKRFHSPILIEARDGCVRSLHVRPPWEAALGREDVHEVVIDPAQAFGTGAHATTRLCIELLLELAAADPGRGVVLDVGAGSGVLAISAAKLGYGPVVALDNDVASVAAAQDNAAANGVAIEARRFDLRAQPLPYDGDAASPGPPIVLANLLRGLLLDLSNTIKRPPSHMIVSGLLREEADEVSRAFVENLAMCERERRERGEWAALWLVSQPPGSR